MYTGPHIIKDGLVFGYDTGYGIADNNTGTRFYPGESTDNKLRLFTSNTLSNPTNIYRVTVTEQNTVDSSAPNGQYSRYTGIDSSSNNQVFYSYAGSGFNYTGQTITYSVYLKGSGTCHLTTYDDQSGYGTTGTITLTDEWVRYSYTSTVNSSASSHWSGVRGIISSTDVYVAASQMEIKGHSTPFTSTSRSSTSSLIDLKETTDINVSNVSFDSTGQPDFDGTDDYFTTSGLSTSESTNITFETVIRFNGTLDTNDRKVFHWDKTGTSNGVAQIRKGNNNGRLMYQHHNGSQWYTLSVDNVITSDTFAHIVVTHNGTTAKMYKNGAEIGTTTVGNLNYASAGEILLGYRTSAEYWKGNIPIFKVYTNVLSASEIKQNYNAYKNRFDI